MPESIRHILPGVHADSIQTCYPNPPECVLNKVTCYLGVVLVQVRQKVEEPAFHRFAFQLFNRAQVMQYPGLKDILEVVGLCAIKPGSRWRVINPGMIRTSMIDDFVLNNLDA